MGFPQKIRASAAVASRARHEGVLPLAGMPRLRGLLADPEGSIEVQVAAAPDAGGQPTLTLKVDGALPLACERCGKTFRWPLAVGETLRLVHSDEEEARLLAECEPYRVEDDWVPLHELVEDEVLLELPMLPRCEACDNMRSGQPESPSAPSVRPNPFAQLKLKT